MKGSNLLGESERAEKSGREPNTAEVTLAKRSEEKASEKLSKNFEKRLDKLQKVWYNKIVAAMKNKNASERTTKSAS